jgi:hypothetical protein
MMNAWWRAAIAGVAVTLASGCGPTLPPAQAPGDAPSTEGDPTDVPDAPGAGVPADAHAEDDDGAALVARNFAIAPGGYAECNLQLAAGVQVTATFRGDGPLAWNVHSHPDGGLAIHQEGVAPSGAIVFTSVEAGGYSYLWKNTGKTAVNLIVSMELPDGATIASWQPTRED